MTQEKNVRFALFRQQDEGGAGLEIMESAPLSEVAMAGAQQLIAAGVEKGHENRVLFAGGGMSLIYAWFKSGYPLPRHTHNSDCLYYIIGGSLKMGTEELRQGDGFFVGKDVPYAYVAGEQGVEILEFRATEQFDISVLANNAKFWQKAAEQVKQQQSTWETETKPSTNG